MLHRRSTLRTKMKPEKPKAPRVPKDTPKTPPVAPTALRALAEQLTAQRDAYEELHKDTLAWESKLLSGTLNALGPAVPFLCTIPTKAVNPIRPSGDDFLVLVPRVQDAIVLRKDGTLALHERDAVHAFESADEFVGYVGVGYAAEIAHACNRELKRALARLPGLIDDLNSYRAQLGDEDSEGESDNAERIS